MAYLNRNIPEIMLNVNGLNTLVKDKDCKTG